MDCPSVYFPLLISPLMSEYSSLPRFDMSELISQRYPFHDGSRPSICCLLFPGIDFDLVVCVRFRQQEDGSIVFDPNIKEVVFEDNF